MTIILDEIKAFLKKLDKPYDFVKLGYYAESSNNCL